MILIAGQLTTYDHDNRVIEITTLHDHVYLNILRLIFSIPICLLDFFNHVNIER